MKRARKPSREPLDLRWDESHAPRHGVTFASPGPDADAAWERVLDVLLRILERHERAKPQP
jgi:hypothetical protein